MWLFIFGAILLIVDIILIIIASKQIKLTKDNNKAIEEEIRNLNAQKCELEADISHNGEMLLLQKSSLKQLEETAKNSFETYHQVLENQYNEADKEYDELYEQLKNAYDTYQDQILGLINQEKEQLEKLSATRKAAIEAQLKEEAIQAKAEFYSLSLDEIDLHEAKVLTSIESELRDARPIRMIVWQTYYSKRANDLAARVLETGNPVSGIYKITNKLSGLCYIGQARDIRERWREHMKCGLGIDTPASNKLYQAMKKDGIDNFTFELLEKCPVSQLDEKESFYINLYQSKEYGYNSTSGNKR